MHISTVRDDENNRWKRKKPLKNQAKKQRQRGDGS